MSTSWWLQCTWPSAALPGSVWCWTLSGQSALDWDEMEVMLFIVNLNKTLTHYPAGVIREPVLHCDHPGAGEGGPGPFLRPGREGRGLQARMPDLRLFFTQFICILKKEKFIFITKCFQK